MKCRGCGLNDHRATLDGGPGPMHPECEIRRLAGLYEQEQEETERLRAKLEAAEELLDDCLGVVQLADRWDLAKKIRAAIDEAKGGE